MPGYKKILFSALFVFFTTLPAFSQGVDWISHDKALETAADQGKKVYFYFQSPQCPWCRTMEEKTLADPDVAAYLNAHFASARIDVDKNTDFARRFRVSGVPANIFLSSAGEGLFTRPGYVPPETFLRILKILNTGKHDS